VTIGKVEQTRHSTLVAGARWLTAVEPLGCPLEVFAAFRLTRQGGDETSGVAVDMRYFWDKRTFTGLHFTTDTDKFSLSGGIWTGRGFRAEIEAGNENKADFLTLTAGLAF